MKYLRNYIIIIFSIAFILNITAQTNGNTNSNPIKPFRIGIKVGVPNLATVNAEYVTPLLDDRVAVSLDYMSLTHSIEEVEIGYDNFEIGANIYINNTGQGFYGGVSYFNFGGEGTFPDVEFDDGSISNGTGDIEFNTINLKLGLKFGRFLYTRLEFGYGFGEIPEFIEVTNESGTSSSIEDMPEIPGLSSSGLFTANIGFGIQF